MSTVPALSMIMMVVSLLISLSLPVGLFLYLRLRRKADILPFFVGAATFVVFALILEQILHTAVLASPLGEKIQENTVLLALYGGAAAGLFEEAGRYLAMAFVLKKYHERNVNALMYGAGHGGIEALVLLGVVSINNLITSLLINSGGAAMTLQSVPEELRPALQEAFDTLINTSPWAYLAGGAERIPAVIAHLCMSVWVWFSVTQKKPQYLAVAFLLHFGLDAVAVLLTGATESVLLIELGIAAFVAGMAVFTRIFWKKAA